jgi:hypothetical protein
MSNTPALPPEPNANAGTSSSSSLEAVLERIKRLANQTNAHSSGPPLAPPAKPAAGPVPASNPNATLAAERSKPQPQQEIGRVFRRTGDLNEPMIPVEPASLQEAGLSESILEDMATRLLLARGEMSGRAIADQFKLPFGMVEPTLMRLKAQQLTVYSGATAFNDYIHSLTDAGRDRARRNNLKTTYYGSAPVPIDQYIESVKLQTIESQHPTREDLKRAFSDLLIPDGLLSRLGPAINSGRGMFLYGNPGNGKTSIAERVTKSFGHYIWIPRAILIDGEIMRLFDPLNHQPRPLRNSEGLLVESNIDRRWIRVLRPTIIAGGELTMSMLEITRNPDTNICEAPLQLKSNCGVLLMDDFGRQRISVQELLNRWMIPLEQRHDYLSLQSGKRFKVPFDQLVVFSTNLQPKDLVDDAFLRRIPYKIEVPNPSETEFRKLFHIMAKTMTIAYKPELLDYLISTHYKGVGRSFRNCQPRDLLMQIRSYCLFNNIPLQVSKETIDFAVDNYFAIM